MRTLCARPSLCAARSPRARMRSRDRGTASTGAWRRAGVALAAPRARRGPSLRGGPARLTTRPVVWSPQLHLHFAPSADAARFARSTARRGSDRRPRFAVLTPVSSDCVDGAADRSRARRPCSALDTTSSACEPRAADDATSADDSSGRSSGADAARTTAAPAARAGRCVDAPATLPAAWLRPPAREATAFRATARMSLVEFVREPCQSTRVRTMTRRTSCRARRPRGASRAASIDRRRTRSDIVWRPAHAGAPVRNAPPTTLRAVAPTQRSAPSASRHDVIDLRPATSASSRTAAAR